MFPKFSKRVLLIVAAASCIAALLVGFRIVNLFPLPTLVKCSVAPTSSLSGFYNDFKKVFVDAYYENVHGVDVRNVADTLDKALKLVRKYRLTKDSKYLDEAVNLLQYSCKLLNHDVMKFRNVQNTLNIVTAAAIAVVPPIVYVLLTIIIPVLYVKFKLWYLSIFEIVPSEGTGERKEVSKSVLMDEEVFGVVAAICIVVTVFVIGYVVTHSKVTEPFSAIGLLGPTKKIGGYPRVVMVGQKFLLWVYLFDYEGKIMWYRVLIKLGNRTTFINSTIPAHAPVIDYVEACLYHNESTLIPVWLSINRSGSYKLIFEVWYYNVKLRKFVYKGIWTHIYINVTRR